jgi:hypothetical protein
MFNFNTFPLHWQEDNENQISGQISRFYTFNASILFKMNEKTENLSLLDGEDTLYFKRLFDIHTP